MRVFLNALVAFLAYFNELVLDLMIHNTVQFHLVIFQKLRQLFESLDYLYHV